MQPGEHCPVVVQAQPRRISLSTFLGIAERVGSASPRRSRREGVERGCGGDRGRFEVFATLCDRSAGREGLVVCLRLGCAVELVRAKTEEVLHAYFSRLCRSCTVLSCGRSSSSGHAAPRRR